MFRRLPTSHVFPSRFLFTAFPSRRPFTTTRINLNANESSSFREGASRYKAFVSPFAKVFLGAIFTYQVIYWTWLKLEMDESKYTKNQEVAALEKQAKELTGSQK
ncbi:hypothetical protein BDV23DRAFT_78803 [Aspergillus alliaceus]|uniref:Uncharacterized protein n=1 Tax=Petromyces alliaceus TaxID=209559 RepID=A0A5N6FLT0_PETAA|nr:uncharacterized protein BDW43DRAFT_169583 [Aspergillus alliaceus]KAB8230175.1 hypothetical protein BDW43DRAFT_169583 [Aspergillus alliaceus]KAE8390702.1 hypothetical protein BDV23DRAFT_78803 [Aspergillus alliaceus]